MAAPMMDPKQAAIQQMMAAKGGGGPMPPAPMAGPTAPQGGTQQHGAPMEVAIKLLDAIVAELSKIHPQQAQELATEIQNLKAVLMKIGKEISAQGQQGGPSQGSSPAPAPVPGPAQPMPSGRQVA